MIGLRPQTIHKTKTKLMKTLYLSAAFCIICSFSKIYSQPYLEWENSYNGSNPNGSDEGKVIALDNYGNVYVGGKTASNSNFDFILIKYNSVGDTVWTRTYNGIGNGDDEILDIEVDFNGNVFVTGKSIDLNYSYNIVTLKYNNTGNLTWSHIYGNLNFIDDIPNDIKIDNFGNVYIGGGTYWPNGSDGLIYKLASNGDLVWSNNIDNWQASESVNSLELDNFGKLIVLVNQANGNHQILEYNAMSGMKTFSYSLKFCYPSKIKINNTTGDIYILGNYNDTRAFLYKYNHHEPNPVWVNENNHSYSNLKGIDLVIDNDFNCYIIYNRRVSANDDKYIELKIINQNGIEILDKTYNLDLIADDIPINLFLNNSLQAPNISIVGYFSTGNIFIYHLNNLGNSIWTEIYDCGNNKIDVANSSINNYCDEIFITGYSSCNNSGQDVKTIKYNTTKKPEIKASNQNPICDGQPIILYADTCSTCTYLWSNAGTADSIIIHPDSTTEYQVTVTNNNGCETVSLPYKVVVKKLLKPEVTITSITNAICVGSSTTITAQTVNAGSTPGYLWHINGSLQTNQNTSTLIVSPAINSQIQCILTTSEQCYTQQKDTSNVFTVTVNPLPIASINALSNTTFCSGSSVLLAPSQGTSYLWSNGSTADTLVVDKSGAYKVTLTDENGCSNASNEIIVTVNDLPIANIMQSGSTTFCKGDSVILTASSASIYSWSTGATGNQIIVKNSGQFNVTVTDQNGCQAISQTINVTVHPLPTVSIISTGDLNFCQGESETLTSSTAGNLYKWSNGQTTPGITVTENGVFQLTITDANGCQGIASPVTISVFPLPTVSVNSSGPTTFCEGNNIILTASSASSYLWSNGTTTQTATINTTGSYSVTVTDENGCKNSSIPITINVNPLPMALISPSGNLHICAGDSVKLVATGGNQYLWSNTQTSKDIVVKESGNYQVTVTDNNGCFSMSLSTTIVVDSIPNVAIKVIGNLQFCDGDSVILEAYNAESYLWSNGANTQTITLKNNEIINVTGTNSFGCKSISTTYTTEKLPLVTPKVEITTPDLSVCEGASVSFNTNTINGGTEPTYQWFVNSMLQPDNSAVFSTNTLGNGSSVYCIMTSNEKCVTTQSDKSNVINIAVNALKTPTIEIIQESDVILECENGVFKAQITYGGNSPTYQWYVNDILTSTGPNLIYHEFITGDKVQCQLKSSAECLTANNILSNTIVANVINKELPIITIQNGTIKASNYSTNKFTYTWYLNGAPISTNESIECSDFGPGEYNLEVSINGCTFPSQSFQVENCTVGIDETNHSNQITIFPNPTRGVVQITSALTSEQQFDVKVINSLGITVFSQKMNTTGFLDISHLQNGIYILILNEQYVFKAIKI